MFFLGDFVGDLVGDLVGDPLGEILFLFCGEISAIRITV